MNTRPTCPAASIGCGTSLPRSLRGFFRGLLLLAVSAFTFAGFAATITTDQLDYPPGSIAIISGEGWAPGETVTLEVDHVGGEGPFGAGHDAWTVTADENGNVSSDWFVNPDDSLDATFLLTADGSLSGEHAEWTFTDGVIKFNANLGGTASALVSFVIAGVPGSTTLNVGNGWQANGNYGGSASVIVTYSFPAVVVDGATTYTFVSSTPSSGSSMANNTTVFATYTSASTCTAPTLSETHGNVSCNGGSDGSINLILTGGTGTFTYLWSNGAITEDISGLAAGTYSVTVTATGGCTATTSVTITEPALLVASSVQGPAILCNGETTTVTVSAVGGTAPYSGDGEFTVGAGPYSYTVTDANGCTSTTTGTVSQPALLVASSVQGPAILCNGETTTVTVSAVGGTAPYSGDGEFTVGAGPYSYTVTDANGCTSTTTGTVSQPALLVASSVQGPAILCNGGTTTVTVSAVGGTAPYSGDGEFTVSAGPYSYTVTDANGCTSTTTGTVSEPALLVASSVQGPAILCNGGTTTVTVSAVGGTAPYSGDGEFTVSAGPYSYTVTDANGCTSTTTGTVSQPTALVASSSATTIVCFGDKSTVTVTATGGTAPYSGDGEFEVSPGTYTYTVTDANGCTDDTTITVAAAPDYGFNGFLPPVGGADATGGSCGNTIRTFKLGSTIPFKFIATCDGNVITTGIHTIKVEKCSSTPDVYDPVTAVPTDAATTGNQFRLTDGQWHYNLSTKSGYTPGAYRVTATLADSSTHFVYISLKK